MIKIDQDASLTRLGWIARKSKKAPYVHVRHGRDVEIGENFVVEGVWDSPFEDMNFDVGRHFFGTGLKITDEAVVAVPSTGLVDRIFVGESDDDYYISNSLIEILASTDSNLIPSHNYKSQTGAIRNGLKDYPNDYPVNSPILINLKQFFYHAIIVKNNSISVKERPPYIDFEDYGHYISTMTDDLSRLSANATSSYRRKTFEIYTTISKGYDSAAATALASDLPLKGAFTSRTATSPLLGMLNKSWNDDDGTGIAEKLGIKVHYLDHTISEVETDEPYFHAATTGEPEVQLYKLHKTVASSEKPCAIITGYHGDTVWSISPKKNTLTDDILKPSPVGLTLAEARLQSGFILIPVPLMHAHSIMSLHSISKSQEMSKWSIGGNYDRPIPRRILESKGVGRGEFGMTKKAVASFYDLPMNPTVRTRFLNHMKQQHGKSLLEIRLSRVIDNMIFYLFTLIHVADRSITKTNKIKRPLNYYSINTPYHMHVWSLSELVTARTKELKSYNSENKQNIK